MNLDECRAHAISGDPEPLAAQLEWLLPTVSRPARYTGGEWNAWTADWPAARLRVALAYPDLYAAVGVHSGLACGAASDLPSAFAAMRGDGTAAPRRTAADEAARVVPTIVFHADRDATVHPCNGDQVVAQAGAASNGGLRTNVERGQVPLAALPEWVRRYALRRLRKYDIELFCDSTIVKAGERSVWLASGQTFNNALFVWSEGMSAGRHIESLAVAKNIQGRIIVDDYLSFGESCFAAGDAACILHKGQTLRMAVQFALSQGRQAAYNILRSIVKMPLKKYRPLDLGWIVPMADNRACGIALGVSLQGYWAGLLHYSFCLLRLPGLKARWGMIKDLLGCQCQKS